MSDAEKIRLKRIAKLQTTVEAASSVNSASLGTKSSDVDTCSSPKIDKKLQSVSLSIKSEEAPKKSETSNVLKAPSSAMAEPITEPMWQHQITEQVLLVSTDNEKAETKGLIYLQSLHQELLSENRSPLLVQDVLDQALLARLSMDNSKMQPDNILDYLLGCYSRVAPHERNIVGENSENRRNFLQSLKRLIVSYAGLSLQMPDMFPQPEKYHALGSLQLYNKILTYSDDTDTLSSGFLQDLIARFEVEGLDDIFVPILNALSGEARQMSLSKTFMPPFRALAILCNYKPIVQLMLRLPNWMPTTGTARDLEMSSFLGPFFRPSVFPMDDASVADTYFMNVTQRTHDEILNGVTNLRSSLRTLHQALHEIVLAILKTSPSCRDAMLQWFADIITRNEKRAQLQVDLNTVSSHSFMCNLTAVMLRLCDPFMSLSSEKNKTIEPLYFFKTSRMTIQQNATPLAMSLEAYKVFLGDTRSQPSLEKDITGQVTQDSDTNLKRSLSTASMTSQNTTLPASPSTTFNFITECFFLTVLYQHYGWLAACSDFISFMKEFAEAKKSMKDLSDRRAEWESSPSASLNEALLQRMKTQIETMSRHEFAYETVLADTFQLDHLLQFNTLVATFVLRMASLDTHESAMSSSSLSLGKQVPTTFAAMPEFLVEDVIESVLFVTKCIPSMLKPLQLDSVVTMAVSLLSHPTYIHNPYLRAKLVEMFYMFVVDYQSPNDYDDPASRLRGRHTNSLVTIFDSHPLVLGTLASALMRLYVDVEATGSHTQFYDKFNIRYHIMMVFKYLWTNATHRARIQEESQMKEGNFVRFIHLLMNDTTFLLDESLRKLSDIHTAQIALENPQLPVQQRTERTQSLRQNERACTSYMSLANETVHMLQYMTTEVIDPFMRPEIIDRLTSMLNYNLAQLVGPKCSTLKVKQPENYCFNPKKLLSELMDIYLHLQKRKEFVYAVSVESRSYDAKHFQKAISIMRNHMLKNESELAQIERFVKATEESRLSALKEEEDLGDIPEEFLDPLFYTIMKDPVKMPTSGKTVERSSIVSHLLSDPKDPFNRMPLTEDMLIPDVELKAQIQKFLTERKQKKL